MSRILFISCLMLVVSASRAQVSVHFTLNVAPLAREAQFTPGATTRIFVRGSFNDWKGTDCELFAAADGLLYQGTFELPGNIGDSLEFKYVIEKEAGKICWEHNPDPSNPPYGNRILVLERKEISLPVARFHPDAYFSYPVVFSREQMQADYMQMRMILEETHPALYDYTEKRVLDSLFDSNFARIDSAMELRDFLLLLTGVISQVGCGHTSLWIPGAFWNVAPEGLFPLALHIEGGRVFVRDYYFNEGSVPLGSEILSINGEPVAKLVKRLEGLSSSDGLGPAFRTAMVAKHFSVKYAMSFGFQDAFRVAFTPPGEERILESLLQPVGKDDIDRAGPGKPELSLKEIRGTHGALLTVNSFAYYDRVDMFRSFMDSVFTVIDEKGIDRLILDLRGNGGGDPFCAAYLWAFLEPEALPYFEDHYGKYDTLANPVPLAPKPYRGQLFTLIDGRCFSTTGHFCGLLKYHRVGLFVGSETGATYTCTGNATYPALHETGIMVGTARVGRYTAAVKGMNPRKGILPDYPVKISGQDLALGADPVMKKALELSAE